MADKKYMKFNLINFSRNRSYAATPLLLALLAVGILVALPSKAYSGHAKTTLTTTGEMHENSCLAFPGTYFANIRNRTVYPHDVTDGKPVKAYNNCDLNNNFSVAQLYQICHPDYVTFRAEYFYTATNTAGDFSEFRWYSSQTADLPVVIAPIHYHGAHNSDYSFYATQGATMWVSFYDSHNSCETTRKALTVTISSSSAVPSLTQQYAHECGDGVGRVQLTSNTPGVTFELYKNFGGYQFVGSNTSGYFEIAEYLLQSHNGYYGKIVPNGPCVTTGYHLITFMGTTSPGVTGTLSICEGATTTLTATGNAPGFRWFDSGGNQVHEGAQFPVPSNLPAGNTTYTVRGFNSGGCITTAATVTVNVNRPISATGFSNSRIGPGIVMLSASPGAGGNSIRWYSADGSLLATGTSFTTPYLSTSVTYYAASYNTSLGCEGSLRVPVTATIQSCDEHNPFTVSQVGQICYPQNVEFRAVYSYNAGNNHGDFSEFRWYDTEHATTPVLINEISPAGSNTGGYLFYATQGATMWVSFYDSYNVCETSRKSITVNILPPPQTIPLLSQQYAHECGDGVGRVQLTSNTPGVTFELYKDDGGYQFVDSNTSGYFEIAEYLLQSHNGYYGKIVPNGPCVTTGYHLITFMGTTSPGVTGTLSICEGATTTLTATGNAPGFRWFDSGGNQVREGAQFTVPSNLPAGNTTYTVRGFNSGGCITTAATVTVNVNRPISATGFSNSRVNPGTVMLSASPGAGGNSIRWYSADGSLLATGTSFTTPYLSTSVTYYAASYNTSLGCEGSLKVPVTATIQSCDEHNPFTVSQVGQICYPQNVEFRAEYSYNAGNNHGDFSEFRWYDTEHATTPVLINEISPAGSNTGGYSLYATQGATMWVSFYDSYNVCETSRQSITVNILPPPQTIPALSQQYAQECGEGIGYVQLISDTPGVTFQLYKDTGEYQLVDSNTSGYFEIPEFYLQSHNGYYGKILPNTPCTPSVFHLLNFDILGSNLPVVTGTLSVYEGETTTLSVSGIAPVYRWFDSEDNQVHQGSQFTVPSNLPLGNTTYVVRGLNSSGCSTNPAYVVVNVVPNPAYVPNNYNYVIDNTIVEPGVTDVSQVSFLGTDTLRQLISYFDGLGRPMQSVIRRGSPLEKDIIQPLQYDGFGREAKKYLPFASQESNGWYEPNAVGVSGYEGSVHDLFYTNGAADKVADDTRPYAETTFEASPLNRPTKQLGAGADWYANNKSVQHGYLVNVHGSAAGQETVIAWKVDENNLPVRSAPLTGYVVSGGYYATGQLRIKSTRDEHGYEVREYTDKDGRIILRRVQATPSQTPVNDTNFASTYYIYDDLGNLAMVLPPEAVTKMQALINQN
jgi:hypothetical protein